MDQRSLLDSDMLSEVIKGVEPNVLACAENYAATIEALDFTSVSVLEILYGLNRKMAATKIRLASAAFAKNHEIVPTPDDYRLAAEICGALDRQGTPIGLMDPLIAACALRLGYRVATGNTAHFEYIRRAGYPLEIENWRAGF